MSYNFLETSGEQRCSAPRIGLLNIMPSSVAEKTERNWQIALGNDVALVPLRFDEDQRLAHGDADWLLGYAPFSDVRDELDGIVVTGANAERSLDGTALPFAAIHNIDALREVIDWAESDARLAIYSCLSSHIALGHLFGAERALQRSKTFGVFCHDVIVDDVLTEGLEMPLQAPHSRWGTIHPHVLEQIDEVDILVEGYEPGWLLAKRQRPTGLSIFLQGHPEYGPLDLHDEYIRDAGQGGNPPVGYYKTNDLSHEPVYRWEKDSIRLFANITRILTTQNILA